MTAVKYPFAVKFNGTHYKPGAVIEVQNAAEHIKQGAVEVKRTPGRKKAELPAEDEAHE